VRTVVAVVVVVVVVAVVVAVMTVFWQILVGAFHRSLCFSRQSSFFPSSVGEISEVIHYHSRMFRSDSLPFNHIFFSDDMHQTIPFTT